MWLPPVSDYAEWLVGVARRIGLSRGEHTTSFEEIAAWCALSRVQLTLWECETVIALSSAFVGAVQKYREAEMMPPWMPDGLRESMEAQMSEFDAEFGALPSPASRKG